MADDNLKTEVAVRIDAICQQFEACWQRGESPNIGAFLDRADTVDRDALAAELERLDHLLRHQQAADSVSRSSSSPAGRATVRAEEGDLYETTPPEPGEAQAGMAETPASLGRYQVTGQLGHGGFGVVYRGYDPLLRRDVAIKVPRRDRIASPADAEKYLAEAQLLARLNHPGIVPVYDFGRSDDGLCYVVSQFIAGGDLAHLMARRRPSFEESAELLVCIAEALHHAHQHGLVHRDIKPGNILIDREGRPLVADFGLALTDEEYGRFAGVFGTPAYMSPEQARGEGHRVDARSDIYSLGVMFYELLTGRRPYRASKQAALLEEVSRGEARPPRQLDHTIPKELERICLKALARRASDRYTTAFDFAEDLRHAARRMRRRARSEPKEGQGDVLPLPPGEGESEGSQLSLQREPSPTGSAPPDSSTPQPPPKIIPKGLRSFDAHDADFFLQLLPGPTDREGLPESIRFWKTRIEQLDADQTFKVGLLYGPSGCGKSSLVKAGLLPRLAPHVVAVFLEATPDDTEARLLRGLQKTLPLAPQPHAGTRGEGEGESPAGGDLTGVIAQFRRGQVLPSGQKLLIVLDQFEQWLHAHRDPETSELVRALRQCDGAHVQCLVMVRDDFWMAASQFLRELEIPLLEGENSAAVYLFDTRHARRVLTLFGCALGCLPGAGQAVPPDVGDDGREHARGRPAGKPELPGAFTPDQQQFVEQAAAELAEDGKVVSVRLALFAEMVKSKPWTPATLKAIGGISGVGATFLEETFSASTAPPQHRLHQHAARAVLKALLPEAGTEIKGHCRSREELLAASGYARRPVDFAELMRILDSELRLVTPADAVGQAYQSDGKEGSGDDASPHATRARAPGDDYGKEACNPKSKIQNPKSYQLTHDYLVPSLRDWLTRKQRETRRGRAELRLAERAAAYAAKPDARQLPGWWEWPNALLFTRRRNWTPAERRMMRAAGRRRGLQAMFVAITFVAATLTGREVRRRVQEDRDLLQADGVVQRLLVAPLVTAPRIASELAPYHEFADPKLRQVLTADSDSNAAERLRASIGLLEVDPSQAGSIFEAMLNASPEEARVLIGVLRPHRAGLIGPLWQRLMSADAMPSSRLCAALALADYATGSGEHDRWLKAAPFVVAQMLAAARKNPSQYEPLVAGLAPAAEALLPPLAGVFHDAKRSSTERELATNILARYAAGNVKTLVDLINDAQPEQFLSLYPALEKQASEAIALLTSELEKRAAPDWHDPPLDPAWPTLPESVVARVEATGGMLTERFALVQALPLDEFAPFAEELRSSGYRPLRCRPYAAGDRIQVAAVWTRDPLDWKSAVDLTADEVLARNDELQTQGYLPVDVAGYTKEGATRFAALWALRSDEGDERRLFVDVANDSPPGADDLKQKNFGPATLHAYAVPHGSPRYALIWQKGMSDGDWQSNADMPAGSYAGAVATDRLELDVSLLVSGAAAGKEPRTAVAHLEQNYSSAFVTNATYVSVSPYGLSPEEHLARCRELAKQGYRPAAMTLAQPSAGEGVSAQGDGTPTQSAGAPLPAGLIAASVWRLPRVEEPEKERLAQRQANAAVALVRLGQPQPVWPLLAHRTDPRLRSWLVHRLGPLGAEPKLLIERLFAARPIAQPFPTEDGLFDHETSIRRALLLALGEFDEARLPPAERAALNDELTELYGSDVDAGIHAAAAWLLRRWGHAEKLAEIDARRRGEKPLTDGRRWFVNSQGQTMVVIEGPVEFLMGSPGDEPGREMFEPLHRQRIDRSFAVSAYEVTVDEVKRWRQAFDYGFQYSPTADCPMTAVNWYQAAEYCNWLSEQEGLKPCYEPNSQGQYAEGMRPAADYLARDGYRLPTEAEWEFACRAGATTSRYYGASTTLLGRYAWYEANSQQRAFGVGLLKPNDLGLFDMLGNAVEWCGDPFSGAYAHRRLDRACGDVADVSTLSEKVSRVLRGGSFGHAAPYVCSGNRNRWYAPSDRNICNGFRLVRAYPDARSRVENERVGPSSAERKPDVPPVLEPDDKRIEWAYVRQERDKNSGSFKRNDDATWSETNTRGETHTFEEWDRNLDYVLLVDPTRNACLRCYDDRLDVRLDDGTWRMLYQGSWVKQ